MIDDVTTASLHAALRGLSARRGAEAQNIANVDTAGYLAQRVDFESALGSALDAVRHGTGGVGRVGASGPQITTSADPTRLNGNNVNLDDEFLSQEQTELAYSTVLEAMSAKFRLMRTAIKGQ